MTLGQWFDVLTTEMRTPGGSNAFGLSTNEGVRFQGFHGTLEGFHQSRERDALKERLLCERQVRLLRVQHDEPCSVEHLPRHAVSGLNSTTAIGPTSPLPREG